MTRSPDNLRMPSFDTRQMLTSKDPGCADTPPSVDEDRSPEVDSSWAESGIPELPAGSRFQDAAFLGQGGMGTVFSAFDPQLGRRVALKLLRAGDSESRMRFTLEAHAQAQVDHPCVIKLFEVGSIGDLPYIAMPLLEGQTLIQACIECSLAEKVRILHEVAEGLHAAHLKGLLHRDIKPANIMVVRTTEGDLHPYIMDFGLVARLDDSIITQVGQMMGTVAFMSPELLKGERASLDGRSDIFSLGATAYQLLAGQQPFTGENHFDVLRKVIEIEPRPLKLVNPELPEDLAIIVHTCLAKDPDRRYQSALALAQDLERFLQGRPIHARPPSRFYLVSKWIRRNRTLAWTSATLAAALLLVASWASWIQYRTRTQTSLAMRFGREAELVSTQLQLAWMAPFHDVRPQIAWAKAREAAIKAERDRTGVWAMGPASAAIGRIEFQLGDIDAARTELQRAWKLKQRTPEVAYALFQVYVHEYQGSHDRRVREQALALVKQARLLGDTELLDGQVAMLQNQPEQAIAIFQAALQTAPWRYDTYECLSWCWELIALQREAEGDATAAREAFTRAEEGLLVALDVTRSRTEAFIGLTRIRLRREFFESSHGGEGESWRHRAWDACASGLQLDPDNAILNGYRSQIH